MFVPYTVKLGLGSFLYPTGIRRVKNTDGMKFQMVGPGYAREDSKIEFYSSIFCIDAITRDDMLY